MKIEVGKSYKDSFGDTWLIEGRLVNRGAGAPFLATDVLGTMRRYEEDGTCSMVTKCNLLPNKVKKEGWCNVYRNEGFTPLRYAIGRIFSSKEEAVEAADATVTVLNRIDTVMDTVKIEWEEEE